MNLFACTCTTPYKAIGQQPLSKRKCLCSLEQAAYTHWSIYSASINRSFNPQCMAQDLIHTLPLFSHPNDGSSLLPQGHSCMAKPSMNQSSWVTTLGGSHQGTGHYHHTCLSIFFTGKEDVSELHGFTPCQLF